MHAITGTAANVHDIDETAKLIREDDDVVYGDSGYNGAEKREEILSDGHLSNVEFRTNRRPSSIKVPSSYKGINWDKKMEQRKSSTRDSISCSPVRTLSCVPGLVEAGIFVPHLHPFFPFALIVELLRGDNGHNPDGMQGIAVFSIFKVGIYRPAETVYFIIYAVMTAEIGR